MPVPLHCTCIACAGDSLEGKRLDLNGKLGFDRSPEDTVTDRDQDDTVELRRELASQSILFRVGRQLVRLLQLRPLMEASTLCMALKLCSGVPCLVIRVSFCGE